MELEVPSPPPIGSLRSGVFHTRLDGMTEMRYRFRMGREPHIPQPKLLVGIARATLHSRLLRRRMLFRCTLFLLLLLGLGVVLLDQIPRHPWLMLAYWLGVTGFTIGVFLLALYDLLAVRRESRVNAEESQSDKVP